MWTTQPCITIMSNVLEPLTVICTEEFVHNWDSNQQTYDTAVRSIKHWTTARISAWFKKPVWLFVIDVILVNTDLLNTFVLIVLMCLCPLWPLECLFEFKESCRLIWTHCSCFLFWRACIRRAYCQWALKFFYEISVYLLLSDFYFVTIFCDDYKWNMFKVLFSVINQYMWGVISWIEMSAGTFSSTELRISGSGLHELCPKLNGIQVCQVCRAVQ